MEIDTLLLTLTKPSRISLAGERDLDKRVERYVNQRELRHGYPDWLGLPDLLVNSTVKTCAGIVLPVSTNFEFARSCCDQLDSGTVRLRDKTSQKPRELYFGNDDELWLEILWAPLDEAEYIPAQLAEVHFYFEKTTSESGCRAPVAVELFHLRSVLGDLGLTLPDLSTFPQIELY